MLTQTAKHRRLPAQRTLLFVLLALCSFSARAQNATTPLKLIPAPREARLEEGAFTVSRATKIVLGDGADAADRVAAETLADEIAAATGLNVSIMTARAFSSQANVIYLARVDGDRALDGWLDAHGLKMDDKFDPEGYVLGVTGRQIVVAARSSAGLFYGVQTLRQLLRPGAASADDAELSAPNPSTAAGGRVASGPWSVVSEEKQTADSRQLTADSQWFVVAASTNGMGEALATGHRPPVTSDESPITSHESRFSRHSPLATMVCPAIRIRDWPAMRWRGLHDDISRGPVPTLDYIKQQIRTLAGFKLNLYALYIEHTFDYQGHPLIAPPGGALTAAEVREIVEYAARYHVTVLPEQQAFGHLHHVLKNEFYNDLAERPHGHVLAPGQERSYQLIQNLYAELIPLFPGPLFHIGGDETFELGLGQSKARAEKEGLGRVYLEHLKRVAGMMKPHNKRLLFWHDIAAKYPELLGILPKDMVAVAWDYGARASYEGALKPFRAAGMDVMVAPGVSNWNRIYPDLDNAFVNIRNFVRDGQQAGAIGMLNTNWDDDGDAFFAMTWPAVVFGAAASWQPGESSIDQFKAAYDWAFYRNEDATFREAIDHLARAQTLLGSVTWGGSSNDAYFVDPFSEVSSRRLERILPVASDLRLSAERALAWLLRSRHKGRAHPESLDAMILAAMRLDALGMKVQFMQEVSHFYWDAYLNQGDRSRVGSNLSEITGINARLESLRDSVTAVREAYVAAWRAESRPYWLPNVLGRFDYLAGLFQKKIYDVKAARWQYRDQGALPDPRQLGFFLKPQ